MSESKERPLAPGQVAKAARKASMVVPATGRTNAPTTSPYLLSGQTHHRDLGHCRMREQHLFEFLGVDVLAAADDHVLEAALDGAVATFVHRGEVARAQPAVFVDRLSGLSSGMSW